MLNRGAIIHHRHAGTAFDRAIERVRADGVACIDGVALPGVSGVSVPGFDARGKLVPSLTAIGPSATFVSAVDGAVAARLKPAAAQLSLRLGWQPPARAASRGCRSRQARGASRAGARNVRSCE